MPEKIICGIRSRGTMVIARSVFGTRAETIRPIIKPASEVKAIVIYTSKTGGRKMLLVNGSGILTHKTRIALCHCASQSMIPELPSPNVSGKVR